MLIVGNTVYRSQKVAGTMESLLGGHELYHYHSKLMLKDAKTGGAKIWHQDYGYWYNNGCLYPDMGSVFIPLDRCLKSNSCLQVLDEVTKWAELTIILKGNKQELKAKDNFLKKILERVFANSKLNKSYS